MPSIKYLLLSAAGAACIGLAPTSQAQVSIQIGAAPACPYGYYGYAPYHCAPRGYYGPEWFSNGVFIGAGPWYHGHDHFYGHVDNRFDERGGYHGPYPGHDEHYRAYGNGEFRGREMRDEHGEIRHEEHH